MHHNVTNLDENTIKLGFHKNHLVILKIDLLD